MSRADFFSRRRFLEGMGLGLGLLPLLPGRSARAQAGLFPRRLLVLVETNGTIAASFFPQGAGSDLATLTLPEITRPLERHKGDLIFIENLELKHFTEQKNTGGGHDNYGMTFVGVPGEQRDVGDPRGFRPPYPVSPSIDHHIVEELTRRGRLGTPLPKLHLASQIENASTNQKRCFWRGANQPVAPENNPVKAAGSIFGGASMGDPELERLRAERRSMLDFVGKDLERFARRFGAEEKAKVEAHLGSVRDIERQIAALQKVSCAAPPVPANLADTSGKPDARWRDIVNVQFEIAVAALACNVTRIATLQLNNGHGNSVVFSWLGLEGKGLEFSIRDSHDLAHRPGTNSADKIKAETWFMTLLAGFIDKLKAVKEGSGTLLDNTALLYVNHMGNGGAHSSSKLPWIIAGRCGGYLKTGQFVRNPSSVPTHGVLIALANAMGAPTEHFGEPRFGGEMTALRA